MIEKYCTTPNSRLKLMRELLSFSQKQFAIALGVSTSTYCRFEKDGWKICLMTLENLRSFNINPSYVLGDSELIIGKNTLDSVKNKISSHIKTLGKK